MHMADALVSPAVGSTMWMVSSGLIAWSARKIKQIRNDRIIPMMGVMGAFVFTVQMINFSIPATGSSGHLGGGLMLAILLGPYPAFLVIASILTAQSLFFADGGLLALGCNIFNLGFFPVFIAYPLVYRPIMGKSGNMGRLWAASMIAAIVGLQAGAFGVVVETVCSGISDLPFTAFVVVMQSIHLAIGFVEGLATVAVVSFVVKTRPELLAIARMPRGLPRGASLVHNTCRETDGRYWNPVSVVLLIAAILIGGVVSWFASSRPDGLEWAISRVTGKDEVAIVGKGLHRKMAVIQQQTSILPDYSFKDKVADDGVADKSSAEEEAKWPAVGAGSSLSGLLGGLMVFIFVVLIGYSLKARDKTV